MKAPKTEEKCAHENPDGMLTMFRLYSCFFCHLVWHVRWNLSGEALEMICDCIISLNQNEPDLLFVCLFEFSFVVKIRCCMVEICQS